jgi:DNA-binding NarL/FixJ family response regulator
LNHPKLTILLVEDHQIVRKGIKALLELEEDIIIVGEAENGNEAVVMAKKMKPDIIIMDIALPLMNGIEASRQIIKINPDQKILILSAHADDGYIEKAIELGLSGFLVKQCLPAFLIETLHHISNGEKYFSPSILKRTQELSEKHMDIRGRLCLKKPCSLTHREVQVLQLIAEGEGNKQIAHGLDISIKTVEKHRQNLMKKLSIHDTAGLTRYAISEGVIENSKQKTTL